MKGMLLAVAIGLGSLVATASAAPVIIDFAGAQPMGKVYSAPQANPTHYWSAPWWTDPEATGTNGYVVWSFTGLEAAGGSYDVYASWPVKQDWWESRNTASPFTIYDGAMTVRGHPDWDIIPATGTTLQGTKLVNQNDEAAGLTYGEREWFKLGTFSVSGSNLSVLLTNNSTEPNTIIAGAIMIDQVPIPEPTLLALVGLTSIMLLRRRNA
jgi:hypothetical protein